MSHDIRWYLVANRKEALIFQQNFRQKGGEFTFVERFLHPRGQLKERELVSDRPGRGRSGPDGARYALDPRTSAQDQEAVEFSQQLGAHLIDRLERGAFDELVIVAEPRFLGYLRGVFPTRLKSCVVSEIRREFVRGSNAQMEAQIRAAMKEDEPPHRPVTPRVLPPQIPARF